MYEFITADADQFAVYHTIYSANIFDRFDWNERVDDTIECTTDKDAYFLCDNAQIIGGFTLKGNRLSYPFVAVPFIDRRTFWGAVFEHTHRISGEKEILLNEIPEADSNVLMQSFAATKISSKQKMIRPTGQYAPVLADGFCFDDLTNANRAEIIETIYSAHANGFTSTVEKPDMAEIQTAVERRFVSFGQTDTLYMSNVVRNKETHDIAGVCIAGIYPSSKEYSSSSFATIHQVSVKPEYRRKGIAKAMMLKSIDAASGISPAITLGVLIGNPAERLYEAIGFRAGPSYSELRYLPGNRCFIRAVLIMSSVTR